MPTLEIKPTQKVIDQYRVTRDDKGNIASEPNRSNDEQYVVRLICQVITISLETMRLVKGLPPLQPTSEETKAAGKRHK
jgi:predicted helicase